MKDRMNLPIRAAALAFVCAAAPLSAAESDWEYSATLYGWMAGLQSDVSVNGQKVGEIDMSFSDILDQLDMTLMAHGEGFKNEWGFFVDLLYLDMSESETKGNLKIDSDVSSTIFEVAGVYRPGGTVEGLEAFAGIRYFKMDIELDITGGGGGTAPVRSDGSYTDFMVGARYTGRINDDWLYRLRADASGGETEGTWNLLAAASYQFGQNKDKSFTLGYRHMEIDLEDDNGRTKVGNDMSFSGPFMALGFAF